MIDFISLELIEFHDVPIKSINIKHKPFSELEIEIMLWDEDINEYVHNKLIFGKLNHIKPKKISVENNADLEIYSFDYYLESDFFYGKMICLTGFGKPSLDIEFKCKSVEIIKI